ncbi:MAG TPA: PIF1 family DEAD/DEAH box helicase [Negativicutes bacterium]|nr:PIF1 family DEAD/DEAH box helicase [Negativicutes bacterium]
MTQDEAIQLLKMGYNVFLTGAPGSGKTFLLNKYIEYLRKNGKRVAVTASTGIAATHMGGTTIHSWSGLGIREKISDSEIRGLLKKPYLRKNIKITEVLLIDEISMLKPGQFEAVDRICQYFRASFEPFGGMQVICSGDFFQLPPINRYDEELRFVVEARSWQNLDMKICYLQDQHRTQDVKLAELLNHIRSNNPYAGKEMLEAHQKSAGRRASIASVTKLYTHNVDVDRINDAQLAKIEGKPMQYHMTSGGNTDLVASLKRSCLAPETLVLKKGAQVMFIKNNFDEGYVNGTQGQVVDFDEFGMPVVKTMAGQKITAGQADWTIDDIDYETGKARTLANINQLPLRLAWAITVHKSQGMNLDAAEIDLSKCFIEGMGYVALSRLKSLAGLKLNGINDKAFAVHEKALAIDEDFKKNSDEARALLASLSTKQRESMGATFIKNLPELSA